MVSNDFKRGITPAKGCINNLARASQTMKEQQLLKIILKGGSLFQVTGCMDY
jgi:hypothetical protein